MKTFPLHHESFPDAVGKFSRSIVTVCGKKRECVTKSVTIVTNGDNGFGNYCHTQIFVFQNDCCSVTIVTKKCVKTLFCLIVFPKSCKFVAEKGPKRFYFYKQFVQLQLFWGLSYTELTLF